LNWTFEFAVHQFGTAPGFFESIDIIDIVPGFFESIDVIEVLR
jgi:hypothetical protein